jgi:hypothetical protein
VRIPRKQNPLDSARAPIRDRGAEEQGK